MKMKQLLNYLLVVWLTVTLAGCQKDNIVLIEELLNLEMDGKIRNCPGGLYQLR